MSFFIEYEEGHFVDAERIFLFSISEKEIHFSLDCYLEEIFSVKGEMIDSFINNLAALNSNPGLERRYREIKESLS